MYFSLPFLLMSENRIVKECRLRFVVFMFLTEKVRIGSSFFLFTNKNRFGFLYSSMSNYSSSLFFLGSVLSSWSSLWSSSR